MSQIHCDMAKNCAEYGKVYLKTRRPNLRECAPNQIILKLPFVAQKVLE